jgi:hypothetical protein
MNDDRKRKRAHIAMLRDRAIARLKRDGRIGGNVKLDGLLFRVWELNKWPWMIEMFVPRHPDEFDYPALSSILTVRFKGERVLKITFDDERSKLVSYIPGVWEGVI